MKNKTILFGMIAIAMLALMPSIHAEAIIIDHKCTNLSQVPDHWLDEAKNLTIHYAHTSHGGQINSGLYILENVNLVKYSFARRESGTEGLPPIEDPPALWMYDGNPPETYIGPDDYWDGDSGMDRTRAVADTGDYNFSMWAWCGQQSSNSEATTQRYLNNLNTLESEYPDMRFIYITGHTDGTGENGNLNVRNNQVRDYCIANDKVLFDFADIESYDPDGKYFLDKEADDNCDYWVDSVKHNWADEWCAAHPGSDLCIDCDCAHSKPLNCNLKARAFWWMMARLAGWNGGQEMYDGTIYVNTSGWWIDSAQFNASSTPIQSAINNASDGDLVYVYNGTYTENVEVNKQLTIRSISSDPANTIVNASNPSDHAFEVSADYVNISGFAVQNATGSGKAGIYLGNNVDHCAIANNTASNNKYGIYLYSTSGNPCEYNKITNCTLQSNDNGIRIQGANTDHNTIDNNTCSLNTHGIAIQHGDNNNLTNNSCNLNNNGIRLFVGADGNTLTNNILNNNNVYDFYSTSNSDNVLINNTFSSYPTRASFTYGGDIGVKGVSSPPSDPSGLNNIGKYLDITNTSDAWVNLEVSYTAADLGVVNESTLMMYRHNGTAWGLVSEPNGVNTTEDYVYANIIEFSVFAPLGEIKPTPTLPCNCGDICVNETNWWHDGGTFNASSTPIQHAIDNALKGETICVKDGTYNENVDVDKSHIIIRSENGSSVTAVSASLNPDKHVFNITDQTNVTLQGFEIRDAGGTSQNVAGIYMHNASECNISDNIVTNISAPDNNACGILLNNSNDNSFSSSTSVSFINASGWDGYAYGIWLNNSTNNLFSSSTEVSFINAPEGEAFGIMLNFSDNNSFSSSTDVSYIDAFIAFGISLVGSNNTKFSSNTDVSYINSTFGGNACGISLDFSNDTRFSSITEVSFINATFGLAYGIVLGESTNNSFSSNTTVSNIEALIAYGIVLGESTNNSFSSGTSVSFIDTVWDAYGISLEGSTNNRFSSGTSVSFINSTDLNAFGISLWWDSDNNRFSSSTSVSFIDAGEEACGIMLWDSNNSFFDTGSISHIHGATWYNFYSDENSDGNEVKNYTISSYPTTISFTYNNGIGLKSVDTAPLDPAGKANISKYVNATNVTVDSWIFLNVSYEEGDLGDVDEDSLRMWKHNRTDWTEVPQPNGVNTVEKYVYANITSFSIFAPLGNVIPINITITSPENRTYASTCVRLNFTVEPEGTALAWIGYSLDGGANVTITGNTTVGGLSEGGHSIVVYARDSNGNMAASNMVFFILHPADIDGDGRVYVSDLLLLAQAYNSRPGDANWNPDADLNCDDRVYTADLLILAQNYNKVY